MRVTAPHQPDLSSLHPDLNWGKWNSSLDLRKPEDRQLLKDLILEADVVVSGYRPGKLEQYGFGVKDIVDLCSEREKGIIVAQENCYGWYGSDGMISTGVAGICGILDAILQRGEHGGSYQVDIAINYYSQWLVSSVGTYPAPVWDALWSANGRQVFRHYQGMLQLLPAYMGMLFKNSAAKLFKPTYFQTRSAEALDPGKGITMKIVKPVLKFPDGVVNLGFNISTRGNGVDAPKWPKDLSVEIVT
ncbi:hypothetical protein LCER1_G007668 [Lachnellula cervina]|uniref:Uncharacterized protein n=1 Tax=Lachnellula cervina TaxID=1316786 RepID=A0A7D8Z2S6_9HELO|nr:hypothetical protein LCER1_G007668 [Lachnellula cervina]